MLTVEDIETASEDELIFLGQPFASNDINFPPQNLLEVVMKEADSAVLDDDG